MLAPCGASFASTGCISVARNQPRPWLPAVVRAHGGVGAEQPACAEFAVCRQQNEVRRLSCYGVHQRGDAGFSSCSAIIPQVQMTVQLSMVTVTIMPLASGGCAIAPGPLRIVRGNRNVVLHCAGHTPGYAFNATRSLVSCMVVWMSGIHFCRCLPSGEGTKWKLRPKECVVNGMFGITRCLSGIGDGWRSRSPRNARRDAAQAGAG